MQLSRAFRIQPHEIVAFVGGGGYDGANYGGNSASGDASTIGGGINNTASGTNTVVGGGLDNTALGRDDTGCGGSHNTSSGGAAAVGGGG